MAKKMCDISSNNHTSNRPLDFDAIKKAGFDAIMIKATQGFDYINPFLHEDYDGAKQSGMIVGFYHFGDPASVNPAREARYCNAAIAGLECNIGVALDWEVTQGKSWQGLATYCDQWLTAIQTDDHGGRLYSTTSYLDEVVHLIDPWPLWVASWGATPRRACWAWQYGTEIVPGVGAIDASWLYGS